MRGTFGSQASRHNRLTRWRGPSPSGRSSILQDLHKTNQVSVEGGARPGLI